MNLVWDTVFTSEYCMGLVAMGVVFSGGIRYSLVNNVCGVRYDIHWDSDTGSVPQARGVACGVADFIINAFHHFHNVDAPIVMHG